MDGSKSIGRRRSSLSRWCRPGRRVDGLACRPCPRLPLARAGAAVRVRPELLDRLVNQTGEVITTRSRMDSEVVTLRSSLKELTGNLERLRHQLHDMEIAGRNPDASASGTGPRCGPNV